MKTKLTLMLFASVALFLASCTKYPPTSDRLLEDLAILTQYDTKADFNSYKTYSLSTPVIQIKDDGNVPLTGPTAEASLAQIDKNMQARGFVKVAASASPDLGIQVTYYENTTVYAYYYDWWGYYPYYPYYYPVYYTSYTAGMANIELMDLKNATDDNRAAVRWNAFIRGLYTDTHSTSDVTASIDQAFIQTPQLKTSAK
jgi:hypothetical protein